MQERKLSNFGYSFQTKIISAIMTDVNFTSRIYDLIKTDYFESEAIKTLINISLDYFKQYKKLPTLDVFKVSIDVINDQLLKKEVISALRSATKNIGSEDIDFVKKSTIKFCKEQEMKVAILESVEDLNRGDYDSIYDRITNAMKVGMDNDIGTEYFKNVDRRYVDEVRDVIPTGLDIIDDLMKGGLGKGELGVFMAPSGAGKSFILTHIGASAIKHKKRVVHYTLELDEGTVGKRYDAILSGISLDKLTGVDGSSYLSEVGQRISEYSEGGRLDNLIIKQYPSRGVGLMGLRSHIQRIRMLGGDIDMIIMDYADLLKYMTNSNRPTHEKLGELFQELKGFAREMDVPVWTVSQTNKDGLQSEIIEADNMQGAYSKVFPADFIASMSRKAQDKVSNTARIHVIKNRFGADGLSFPALFDTSRVIFKIYEQNTNTGNDLTSKMKTDNQHDRDMLRKRMLQLGKKSIEDDNNKSLF